MSRSREITDNLKKVQQRIRTTAEKVGRDPTELTLIVVTKNFPPSDLEILYELGVRDLGENRNEEAIIKVEQLPDDITWHFLGQIQSRKIRSICQWADVVHSLDSLDHAGKFAGSGTGNLVDFFVQVNLEPERADRGGIVVGELPEFFEILVYKIGILPIGLMTVAPQDRDPFETFVQVREARSQLIEIFPRLSNSPLELPLGLSMGMSNDFEAAITAGATHLRIGSSILGSRLLGV